MKKNLPLLLLVIVLGAVLQSCHFGSFETLQNDKIPPSVRKEIAVLDKKLFAAVMSKDVEGVKQLMAPIVIKNEGLRIDTITRTMGGIFQATDYSLLDEYYTKNSKANITNTIPAVKPNGNDYTITYKALNKEMYVSLMVSKNRPVNCLVTAIYGKYSDGWKINILQIGGYNVLGKTGPDYYAEALKAYQKGYLVNATNLISVTAQLAQPAGICFKYKNNDEMKNFYTKVVNETNIKYRLPLTLMQVKTIPQIFSVVPQMNNEMGHNGIFPLVKYKSGVNLTDVAALRDENLAIQKVIGQVFKGIDKNNAYIVYEAFNNIPDGQATINNSEFIQKLK